MPKLPAHPGDSLPVDYFDFLDQLKSRIVAARTQAVLAANSALIELYWEIGLEILERSARENWGSKVVERLEADLRREFPDMTGLSRRNLLYMRAFAEAWPGSDAGGQPIVQRPVAQLPWGHNIELLTKLDDPDDRLWYAQQAIALGWSRVVLNA
jgi:predicted nuclease of restriction endonuclease-like (RecB) superfamily